SQSKCRVNINGVYNNNSSFGIWGSSAMYCAIDNEWHTISTTNINGMGYSSTISSSLYAGLLNIVATAANDIVSFDFDIKDIRIYRVDNNTYHPPIENGHNGAETLIDFSDNTPNTAEVLNDLFYKYRPGLITTSDESMGANGTMRANGWQGAMDDQASATAPVQITNGLWSVVYANPNLSTNANARVGYIDNYTLSQEELDLMGLSTTGVKSQAVQFTTGTGGSIIGNMVSNTCLFYRIDFKTLLGNSRFPNVLAWSYKVHFSGWAKKIPEYDVGLSFGIMYRVIYDTDGRGLGPTTLLSDNQWHYIDKTFEYYLPNMDNSSNNSTTNAKYIGIAATPSNYAKFINPDTGVAYTATEASHRPAVAMAKVKITFEPSEVYFKDGSHFKLYNYSNTSLSDVQTIRANNQTNFKL
ncbi:MAG: hypothetical protein IKF79_04770, partial [Methanosphaera sp.]|nr:hypothetical protein [Methanosphaera sp.]